MTTRRFAEALAAHDMATLRAAFDACQEGVETGYERTTLNRWLDGSVPVREPFVRCMSERLDDPRIYEAWQEAREATSPSRVKTVVSRFEGLTPEEKDEAFHAIRRDYVSEYPSRRSRLTYRIELDDVRDGSDDHRQLRLAWSWVGDIPANANVQFVTKYTDLSQAYQDANCIFREELPFQTDRLQELLEAEDEQVLTITPLDSADPRPNRHVGQLRSNGTFTFDNAAVRDASIQISISYPYPLQNSQYFVRFGRYQVPDTSEITLILRASGVTDPQAFPYMPPGRQQEWTSTRIRSNEMKVELGTRSNTVLSEGDGVVLYWTEGS